MKQHTIFYCSINEMHGKWCRVDSHFISAVLNQPEVWAVGGRVVREGQPIQSEDVSKTIVLLHPVAGVELELGNESSGEVEEFGRS